MEGFAIGSLIFSIVGLIVFPIVGSILGIVFASAAKRRIAEQPDLEGGQMARAATIVGWAGLALWVVIIGLIVGLVASSDRVVLHQDSVLRW